MGGDPSSDFSQWNWNSEVVYSGVDYTLFPVVLKDNFLSWYQQAACYPLSYYLWVISPNVTPIPSVYYNHHFAKLRGYSCTIEVVHLFLTSLPGFSVFFDIFEKLLIKCREMKTKQKWYPGSHLTIYLARTEPWAQGWSRDRIPLYSAWKQRIVNCLAKNTVRILLRQAEGKATPNYTQFPHPLQWLILTALQCIWSSSMYEPDPKQSGSVNPA